jgi:hypothetical protein
MKIADYFTRPPATIHHVALIGDLELLASPVEWICRIGGRQWSGAAPDLATAMLRGFQCAAEQLREPVAVLIKLKKSGQL